MNANNDPLGVSNLLAVLRRRLEGRPLERVGRQTGFFSSGRTRIVGSSYPNCLEEAVAPVTKNAWRCNQVTKNRAATDKLPPTVNEGDRNSLRLPLRVR